MSAATLLPRQGGSLGSRDKFAWLLVGAIIIGCGVLLFTPGLVFIAKWWNEPEYSHGWLIPVVALFVLWQRRRIIALNLEPGSWIGLPIVVVGLAIYLFGAIAVIQRFPFLALIIVLIGLAFAALGARAARYAIVPIAFLLFAFPLPGSVYVPLSTTLQLISSRLGAEVLGLLGVSVFLDGNIIDLGVYQLQVAEACSGLRYLFPLASFGFLCAWMYRAPFWARVLVFISTAPITVMMNSARIALTGIFIEYGSIELAEGFMHLFEGWVIFIAALTILFAEMWLLAKMLGGQRTIVDLLDFDRISAAGRSAGAPAHSPTVGTPAHSPIMAKPLVACAGLLIATLAAQIMLGDRMQIIPPRPGLATFPLAIATWHGQSIPLDSNLATQVGASDYLLADFLESGSRAPVNVWIAYYDNQLGRSAIHSPKDCLPGGGWEYVSLDTIASPVPGPDGRPFLMNRGVIAKGTEQMVIYYWLDIRGRKITNDTALKFYNLWDSFALGRSDGALVRVMSPAMPGDAIDDVDARLRRFLTEAYPQVENYIGG